MIYKTFRNYFSAFFSLVIFAALFLVGSRINSNTSIFAQSQELLVGGGADHRKAAT